MLAPVKNFFFHREIYFNLWLHQFTPSKTTTKNFYLIEKSIVHLSIVLFATFMLVNLCAISLLCSQCICMAFSVLFVNAHLCNSIYFYFLALPFFFWCMNGFDPATVWLCSYILSQRATVMTTLVYNQSKMIMLYILKKPCK